MIQPGVSIKVDWANFHLYKAEFRFGINGILDLTSRPHALQGALVMPLMSTGYKMGLIKFVLITAEKS